MKSLLTEGEPPAAVIENQDGGSPYILTCEHASNLLPAKFDDLGLPQRELQRHIAWDIGALGVAQTISKRTDSVLIRQSFSRLLIDCNRQLHSESLIPCVSDGVLIPGNAPLSDENRRARIDEVYTPFHNSVSQAMHECEARGKTPIVVSVHSYAPVLNDQVRPWEIGLCYHEGSRFSKALLLALKNQNTDRIIGDNQPYDFELDEDATLKIHCLDKGREGVLIEIRHDLIETADQQIQFGNLIADSLMVLL